MKKAFNSKILIGLVLLVIISLGASLLLSNGSTTDIVKAADIVIPFGEYEKIQILDSEKEIAAVINDQGFVDFIKFDGTVLRKMKPFNFIGDAAGSSVVLESGHGFSAVNWEDMINGADFKVSDFSSINLDSSGKYYIGSYMDDDYNIIKSVVSDISGKKLYEVNGSAYFTSAEGLITTGEGTEFTDKLYNFIEGKVVKDFGKEASLHDDSAEFNVIQIHVKKLSSPNLFDPDHNYYYYITDKNWTPVFSDYVFSTLHMSDDGNYFYGSRIKDITLDNSNEEIFKADIVTEVVINKAGEIIYESDEHRKDLYADKDPYFEEISNGMLGYTTPNWHDGWTYIDLTANPSAQEEIHVGDRKKLHCSFDLEDGYALTRDDSKEPLYGFIDENYNQVIAPIFYDASESENGCAAVCLKNQWGLIKFKGGN